MATSVNLTCSLCDDEGIQNPAVHWCTDCCSFLCYQCSRHHQRNRASKHHHTIAAENYEELPDFIKTTTNQCQKHDKRIEMYCSTHECMCCIQCLADDHKACPDLKNIEDVLSTVKYSASTSNVNDKFTILQQNYNQILEHLEKERTSVNQQAKDKLQEIRNMRQKINVHLDKLEKQLNDEIESKAQSLIVELESTTSRVKSKLKMIEMNIKDHEAMLKCATDLQTFIGLGVMNKRIKTEKEWLDNIKDGQELNKSKLEIKFSPKLGSILCLDYSLGEILHSYSKGVLEIKPIERDHSVVPIQSSISDIQPTLLNTFTVSEEGKETFITGCDLLPNGDFVIADQREPFVKYYDHRGVMTSKTNTENGYPFDVCFIDDNTCAISTNSASSNHEYVLFVDSNTNKIIKKVHIGKENKYLYFNKKLFVSKEKHGVNTGEVICVDPNGRITNRFSTNKSRGIFSSKNLIYFIEFYTNTVVCADESGNMKWRYQDPSIKDPKGIVVDDSGFAFVTNLDSDSIIVIYPDRKKSKVLLSNDYCLNKPFALAIDQGRRKLMVCNKRVGKVFFFQL